MSEEIKELTKQSEVVKPVLNEKCRECANYKSDCEGRILHPKATILRCGNKMKYKKKK